MSNTKQTAVNWLIDQIAEKQNGNGSSISMDEIFEQAKQMEKEQIMDAYDEGNFKNEYQEMTSTQYFSKTYENESSTNTQTYHAFKGELIQDEIGNLKPKKNEQ